MLEKVKNLWNNLSTGGLNIPFIRDQSTGKPSITLFFSFFSFLLLTISIIVLHITDKVLSATVLTAVVWTTATILYMIRKLNKAKIDFNDQSIELDGEDEKEELNK